MQTIRRLLPAPVRRQLGRIRRRLGQALLGNGSAAAASQAPAILDAYIHRAPSAQTAIDIFKDEWSSRLPPPLEKATGGTSPLFEDGRITWMLEQFGGVQGQRVLELGPLEGGHTYMLDRAGAAAITAVEANTRAYLRCLVVRELFDLQHAHFLCGDLMDYLRATDDRFDLCVASGVLYHMLNPLEMLDLCSRVARRLFLWTHYYDAEIVNANPRIKAEFSGSERVSLRGAAYTLYRHHYGETLGWSGFCGGANPHSAWMTRDGILTCLDQLGFRTATIGFEAKDHPNGPSFALTAEKRDG